MLKENYFLNIEYLSNYAIHPEYGILYQIERKPFEYSSQYVEHYNHLDCTPISKIRFDFITSALSKTPTSILDYGYGNGSFLSYCYTQNIKQLYGYDVSPVDPEQYVTRIEHPSDAQVDVVCMFDSLEHTDDIAKTIQELGKHNYLSISVPWCKNYTTLNSFTETYSNDWFQTWKHRKENEHLWHFTDVTLIDFIESLNYKLIRMSNPEDDIRISVDEYPNILSAIFQKK